jgi:LmbE family N-acetylglucosaminyl deacetylase
MNKWLLLIPHPDDEVVGCFATVARARAAGAEVFALYLTTGVPDARWPWSGQREDRVRRRRAEAELVAALMGITPVAFGDRPSRTLRLHLAEARAHLLDTIARHAIDVLAAPAYEGAHQDHDAANLLAATVADRVTSLEFAEYGFAGGRVLRQRFPGRNGTEQLLHLDAGEQQAKRRALALYASERANLRHIGVERECVRPLPAHDYTSPPHDGPLFYERFQWIPFRHPRVDFTSAAEVCAELGQFARTHGLRRLT